MTSRLLVYEAIKTWRKNKTTIVITHDLTPILPTDFVYVVKDGRVVQNGYRADLDTGDGWFSQMAQLQSGKQDDEDDQKPHQQPFLNERPSLAKMRQSSRFTAEPGSLAAMGTSLRSLMGRSSYFGGGDYIHDESVPPMPEQNERGQFLNELLFPPSRSSSKEGIAEMAASVPEPQPSNKRYSDGAVLSLEHAARNASEKRAGNIRYRINPSDAAAKEEHTVVEVENEQPPTTGPRPTLPKVLRRLVPAIPQKWLMMLGYFFCVVSGICMPVFSTLLSQMITILGTGRGQENLLRTALLVFLIAACDGVGMWMKYSLLQRAAMNWVADLRKRTFHRMLSQDKAWFDQPENSPMRLSIVNVADIEDARNVLGMIAGQFLIVIVMLGLGLIWAMAVGWELTLIGLSVAPIMLGVLIWQTSFLGKREQQNKKLREDVASQFHQVSSFDAAALRAVMLMRHDTDH